MKRSIILGTVIIMAALFAVCESPTNPRDEAVSAVAAGYGQSMFIRSDGSLWGCGYNVYGQLGTGDTMRRYSPVQIMSDVLAVSASFYHTLILKTDHTLWACGYNYGGYLGVNDTALRIQTPRQVLGGTDVAVISAGGSMMSEFSLFIKNDGTLWGFGENSYGQIGNGTTTDQSSPVFIRGSVSTVSAGGMHTMIIANDTLYSTGNNYYGQLGQGDTLKDSVFSMAYTTIRTGVKSIAAGWTHTMIIKTTGELYGVGSNESGQFGRGDTASKYRYPVSVNTQVSAVAAGMEYSLIIKNNGSLLVAGNNYYGQLGTGDKADKWTPVAIMSPVSSVSAGLLHSLILRGDGTLFGTGYNGAGQLGNGDTTGTEVTSPIRIWPNF
jgi:alpha-tubulin suppressor-like RCC1 family protein